MKIKDTIIGAFLLCMFFPFNQWATDCIPDCEVNTDWTLEVRGAYYHLPNKHVGHVYSSHWIDYEVETAKRIHPLVELFAGVSWASRHGSVRRQYHGAGYPFKESSRMFVLPVSFGAKWIYPLFPYVDVYLGAGVCYSFLKIKNFCKESYASRGLSHAPFKKATYKNQWGSIFKAGFQIALSDSTFLDFFVDYFVQNFHLSHKKDSRDIIKRNVDCSGYKCGAGFGVYF